MSKLSRACAVAGALLIAASSASGVLASSHREAPLISHGSRKRTAPTSTRSSTRSTRDTSTSSPTTSRWRTRQAGPTSGSSIRPSSTSSMSTTTATAGRTSASSSGSTRSGQGRIRSLQQQPGHERDRPEPARSPDLHADAGHGRQCQGRRSASRRLLRTSARVRRRITPPRRAGRSRAPGGGVSSSPASATTRSSSTSARSSTSAGCGRSTRRTSSRSGRPGIGDLAGMNVHSMALRPDSPARHDHLTHAGATSAGVIGCGRRPIGK